MVLRANENRLLVYQLAAELSAKVVALARTFRGPGSYAQGDQLVRAALSVTSNIAEACGRGSVPEFRQFLLYARGSARELRSQLEIARRIDPQRAQAVRTMENRAALIAKMLWRLHYRPPPDR